MRRRWLIGLGSVVLLVGAGAVVLSRWLGSDDFRQRVQTLASNAVGASVQMQRISLDFRPWPAVGIEGLVIEPPASSPPGRKARPAPDPVTVGRAALQPDYAALLAGRLRLAVLHVDDAVLPQGALLALSAVAQRREATRPGTPSTDTLPDTALLPREVRLQRLSWISLQGLRHTLDADLSLSPDGWPQQARAQVLEGPYRQASLQLTRDPTAGAATHGWQLAVRIGGGTMGGPLRWSPLPADPGSAPGTPAVWQVQGDLVTRQVEVSALTVPSRTLSGRLQATTTLSARVDPAAGTEALLRSLRTQTRFQIDDAVLHGLDLAKAVTTVGLTRGGETSLDTLAGQVNTRGAAIELQNLVATSGVLAATGDVGISPTGSLSGRVRVDMTRGAGNGTLGVPLAVGGTLDDPSVTLTRSALLGAAIGTALMPGVGTSAGANLGDRLGEGLKGLFGGSGERSPQRTEPRR